MSSFVLLAILAVVHAKTDDTSDKDIKADKMGTGTDVDGTPVKDAGGATTEGGGSDFDIEQLMKLIESLKNNDFDAFDKTIKDSGKDKKQSVEKSEEITSSEKEEEAKMEL